MARKARITVHPAYKIGEISKRLYSTFLEPIGTMVNGTMYNPKHPTADGDGFRRDFIDGLKDLEMPACRLPGGNFVSCWDWKDSIGPRDKRKVHLDMAWHQYITNQVGHDEYLKWAELVNTEPMYTMNLGTGSMKDAIDLVEYTNHPGGTYWSDLRRSYGRERPYGVRTWYLGNEMDGPWQLGSWDKDPRGYGVLANELSKAIKWIDGSIETAVCGSSAPFMAHWPDWDAAVLEQCYEAVDYVSLHHYHVAPPGDCNALLAGSARYEDFISTEIALCDYIQSKCRSPKKLMISFDEYGSMQRPCAKLNPGRGYHNMVAAHYRFGPKREYVLHDPDNMSWRRFPGGDILPALTMASTILAFLRHADRVKIACMTGGLGALCASDKDHVWKPASHYILTQLIKHGKGVSMRTSVDCESFDVPGYAIDDNSQYADLTGVGYVDAVSAWQEDKGELSVFVINKSSTEYYPVEIDLAGFTGYELIGHTELYSDDIMARNSYENENAVIPKENSLTRLDGGTVLSDIKPLSWNHYRLKLKTTPKDKE